MYTLLWENPKRLIPRVGRAEIIQQGNCAVYLPFLIFMTLTSWPGRTWGSVRKYKASVTPG